MSQPVLTHWADRLSSLWPDRGLNFRATYLALLRLVLVHGKTTIVYLIVIIVFLDCPVILLFFKNAFLTSATERSTHEAERRVQHSATFWLVPAPFNPFLEVFGRGSPFAHALGVAP